MHVEVEESLVPILHVKSTDFHNGFCLYQGLQVQMTHVKNCSLITAQQCWLVDNIKKGAKKK